MAFSIDMLMMQPNSYRFSFSVIQRSLSTVKKCSHFGRSLYTMGLKCDMKEPPNSKVISSWTNHISKQLRSYSDSKKDAVYVRELLDNVLKNAELPGIITDSSTSRNMLHGKRSRIKRDVDLDDADSVEQKPLTVEKKLLNLMEMWKMDEAVDLLVDSLQNGFTPNSGVILNLLQQLANLGEVENILELHDEFLAEKSIPREVKFYTLLTEAYCNSGRVKEAVAMLKIIYHKTRNFDDTDAFFSMITITVIRNFEHHLYLIADFVNDLIESDPPVDKALACLWRCLVLSEKFDRADALVEEYENLSSLIPAQVSEIIYNPFYITYNKDTVLSWLMNLPHIKRPLKAAVFESLIANKCENRKWQEAMDCLREALANEEAFVRKSTLTLFCSNFFDQLSDCQVKELEELASSLEEQSLTDNELDDSDTKVS